MKPRALKAYGTKRYAVHKMRELMRAWAKARRTRAQDYTRWSLEHEETGGFHQVLGARDALRSVGAFTDAQYERVSNRMDRIIHAKVTRKPKPAEPSRPTGPVVCSFGDELSGKAPPTFGPAAEGRVA